MAAIASLAWARLRYRPARWLLVAAGVAVASALPVLAQGSAADVSERAVAYGVGQLDPGERGLIVSDSGVAEPSTQIAAWTATARANLAPLSATPPRAELLFHRLADHTGGTFFLGAADSLATAVRVTSGRLPASCTPTRCEVVVIGVGTPQLSPDLGLVIVGRAVRTDPLMLGGDLDPGHDSPLLVGDGMSAVAQLESLSQFQRQYAWVTPLDLARVRALGVDRYVEASARADDAVSRAFPDMSLSAPDRVLTDQQARAELSTRRFALLTGSAVALLLGFAALGAIGLRRDAAAVAVLLRRRGTGRGRVALLALAESAVPVVVGSATGALAGTVLAGWRSPNGHVDAGLAALRAAWPAVAGGAVAALAVIALVRSWPTTRPAAAWHVLEAVVVAGVAVAGLAIARGGITTGGLDQAGDPLLAALPVLVVVCGGLLVGRVWPALAAGAARLLPHRFVGGRIGVLGGVRRPLRPVATAAFLAAATGCAVFAATYQATLHQGAAEQAAFTVPLDATVRVGKTLVNPLDVGGATAYTGLVPGTGAYPVIRASAGVRRSAAESDSAQVLGLDPAALPLVPSWDDEVGGGSPGALSASLRGAPTTLAGMQVPPGTTSITMTAGGDTDLINIVAFLRTPDGRDISVPLASEGGRVSGPVPAAATGATLFALTIAETSDINTIAQHHFGEGGNSTAVVAGTIHLGTPQFAGASWDGWGSAAAQAKADGGTLTVGFQFLGHPIVIRAGAAATEAPLPVLTDPDTAADASGGLLSLVVEANTPIVARVVGIAPRFPTAGTRYVVADRGALADALDAREPGSGGVTELWLHAPPGTAAALAAALAEPPYDQLDVALRADRARTLRDDPVATGAAGILQTDALLVVLVAALAVALLVVAERRDEAAELYAWESDGVAPAALRRSMIARACAVVGVGVPGGLLVGVLLAALTTRLVAVTAVGTDPVPPLSLAIGPGWALAVVGAGVLLGLGCAAAVALGALREPVPARPEEVLL